MYKTFKTFRFRKMLAHPALQNFMVHVRQYSKPDLLTKMLVL